MLGRLEEERGVKFRGKEGVCVCRERVTVMGRGQ